MNVSAHSLPDYHTHTTRCGHAAGSATEIVEAARALGLSGIGISDHLPLLHTCDPGLTMSLDQLSGYVEEVQELKARYPGYVYLGIEADYRGDTVDDMVELLATYPFDYVIGSVHFLDAWGFDDPSRVSGFQERDVDEIYRAYYALLAEAAGLGVFTILGHFDLVKKFGHRPSGSLDLEIGNVAERMARRGVMAEINTGGLRKPVHEIYPSASILAILRESGVAVTFGSDAHAPAEVGRDLAVAARAARGAGFHSYASLAPGPTGGPALVVHQPLAAVQGADPAAVGTR